MVELIAANGKTAKHTATGSAPGRKDKRATKARGTTDSNLVECMFGQMAIVLREIGLAAVGTDLALSFGENGCIRESGKKDLKHVTEYRNRKVGLGMKEAGLLVCKKVMASRFMPIKVSFCLKREKQNMQREAFARINDNR